LFYEYRILLAWNKIWLNFEYSKRIKHEQFEDAIQTLEANKAIIVMANYFKSQNSFSF